MFAFRIVGLLMVASSLAACGPSASPAAPTSAPAAPAAASPVSSPAASPKPSPASSPSAAAGAQAYTPTPLNPPVKVSIGLLSSSSDGGILIALEKGYFKQEGIELETQPFQTLVDMVAPAASGQLDIAAGAPAAGLYNAIGRDVNLHIVADKGQIPSPEWDFSALAIRKDLIDSGQVKDYKDLKGLTLVTSGRGNSPEVALATALSKGGLTLNDVNFSQMAFPDMVTALGNKAIDGGIVIEPFLSRVETEGTAVRWKTNLEIFGGRNSQIAVIVYGEKMFTNQELGRRWMIAYLRGIRDYNDAFGPKKKGFDEVVGILTKYTTVKDPRVYAQMRPAGLSPDGKLDVQSMREDLEYYEKSGSLKVQVDLSKLIDASFQENAVRVLGPYVP